MVGKRGSKLEPRAPLRRSKLLALFMDKGPATREPVGHFITEGFLQIETTVMSLYARVRARHKSREDTSQEASV